MMKEKHTHSLLVFMKKKHAYSKTEERLDILADKLGGRNIGGGTNLSNGERDKQYYFKSLEDAKTFLNYPTVQEAIKTNYDLVEIV